MRCNFFMRTSIRKHNRILPQSRILSLLCLCLLLECGLACVSEGTEGVVPGGTMTGRMADTRAGTKHHQPVNTQRRPFSLLIFFTESCEPHFHPDHQPMALQLCISATWPDTCSLSCSPCSRHEE